MDQISVAEENLIIFFFPLIAHTSLKFFWNTEVHSKNSPMHYCIWDAEGWNNSTISLTVLLLEQKNTHTPLVSGFYAALSVSLLT